MDMYNGVWLYEDAAHAVQSLARISSFVLLTSRLDSQNASTFGGLARPFINSLVRGSDSRRLADVAPVETPNDQRRRNSDGLALDHEPTALVCHDFARWSLHSSWSDWKEQILTNKQIDYNNWSACKIQITSTLWVSTNCNYQKRKRVMNLTDYTYHRYKLTV